MPNLTVIIPQEQSKHSPSPQMHTLSASGTYARLMESDDIDVYITSLDSLPDLSCPVLLHKSIRPPKYTDHNYLKIFCVKKCV
jgi:hypothetical protein